MRRTVSGTRRGAAAGWRPRSIAAPPAGAQTRRAVPRARSPRTRSASSCSTSWCRCSGRSRSATGRSSRPAARPTRPRRCRRRSRTCSPRCPRTASTSFENFNGTFGWSDAEYRSLFESYGLHAVADHGAVDTGTWDARLEQAQRLGLKYVGSGGWPDGTNMNTVEGAVNMGRVLNELGTKARAKGLWVYGHNHDAEFRTKLKYDVNGDGVKETVPAIEVVMLNTDPSLVTFEIDVHWALRRASATTSRTTSSQFLRKYSKRISMLHVKGSTRTRTTRADFRASPTPAARTTSPTGSRSSPPRPTSTTTTGSTTSRRTRSPRPRSRSTCSTASRSARSATSPAASAAPCRRRWR